MAYYLAVDAGGTKAEYALANEERVVARVRSGSIKRMRVDAATAASHLSGALSQLESGSGISMRDISWACVGTAGDTVSLVTDWLREEFNRRIGGSLLIKGDVEIALEAAFPEQSGILVLAGTGSQVLGRTISGDLYSAGGYGPALSDQGSGHSIGVRALRSMFLAVDEDRETQLFEAVMAHWQLKNCAELIAYANCCPSTEYSGLAPVVVACALASDAVACAVLEDEVRELAHLVVQVDRRLRQNGSYVPQFAVAGSILRMSVLVRELLRGELKRKLPVLMVVETDVDPVLGALSFARSAAVHLSLS